MPFRNKRYLQPLMMGLAIIGLVFFLHKSANPTVVALQERLEGVFYDIRLRFFVDAEIEHDPRIIIVDIDDRSLMEIGRWPWSRVRLAELLNELQPAAPAVIGLDIIFAEPQLSPLDHLLSVDDHKAADLIPDELLVLNKQLDGDNLFAEALTGHLSVLGYSLTQDLASSSGVLPEPALELAPAEKDSSRIAIMSGYLANLPRFQQSSASAGFVFVKPDIDGIIRWANLLLQHQDKLYASFALSILSAFPFFGIVVSGFTDLDAAAPPCGATLSGVEPGIVSTFASSGFFFAFCIGSVAVAFALG